MLAIITKANDDYWYDFKEINTIEDLLNIDENTIVEPNFYDEDTVKYWDGFKKEDISKINKAKINVIIHNDYVY